MRFIWTKGPADSQVHGQAVEATDGDDKFHVSLPDGFKIPDNATLKNMAMSYVEWTSEKEAERVVVLRQFNSGIQGGDELAFKLPAEDGRLLILGKRTAEERDDKPHEEELDD
jgi:hypothetical protein